MRYTREQLEQMADAEAQRAGIDPQLFRRLITQESGWQPDVTSPVGAYGLTQMMPDSAAQPGFGITPAANDWRQNPQEQLRFGADYLAAMLDRYDGNANLAAAAYNAGPGRVDAAGGVPNIRETQNYVRNVAGGERQNALSYGLPAVETGQVASSGEPLSYGLPSAGFAPPVYHMGTPVFGPAGDERDDPRMAEYRGRLDPAVYQSTRRNALSFMPYTEAF